VGRCSTDVVGCTTSALVSMVVSRTAPGLIPCDKTASETAGVTFDAGTATNVPVSVTSGDSTYISSGANSPQPSTKHTLASTTAGSTSITTGATPAGWVLTVAPVLGEMTVTGTGGSR
jgi:hypothetical protein